MLTMLSSWSSGFSGEWCGVEAASSLGEVGWIRLSVCIGGKFTAGGGVGPPLPGILAVAWFAKCANFCVSGVRGI